MSLYAKVNRLLQRASERLWRIGKKPHVCYVREFFCSL